MGPQVTVSMERLIFSPHLQGIYVRKEGGIKEEGRKRAGRKEKREEGRDGGTEDGWKREVGEEKEIQRF